MNKIKAVLFDMDGVIFDTEREYLKEWNKIFEDTRNKRQAAPDCLFARAYPARLGGAARRAGNVPAEG